MEVFTILAEIITWLSVKEIKLIFCFATFTGYDLHLAFIFNATNMSVYKKSEFMERAINMDF